MRVAAGRALCSVLLGAAQFMDHGQFIRSNVVHQRGRRIEDGWESFPCRELCFGIIYTMIKMFPSWCKTAGSTNGHLLFQPNMKDSLWADTVSLSLSLSWEPSVRLWLLYASLQFRKASSDHSWVLYEVQNDSGQEHSEDSAAIKQ